MISSTFSLDEKKLLYSLRSKDFQAKSNFRKLNKVRIIGQVTLIDIYGSIEDKFKVVKTISQIEQVRKSMKKKLHTQFLRP